MLSPRREPQLREGGILNKEAVVFVPLGHGQFDRMGTVGRRKPAIRVKATPSWPPLGSFIGVAVGDPTRLGVTANRRATVAEDCSREDGWRYADISSVGM